MEKQQFFQLVSIPSVWPDKLFPIDAEHRNKVFTFFLCVSQFNFV